MHPVWFCNWVVEHIVMLALWLKDNEKLAGWAQAVGGFAAIVGAVMIARSDRQETQRADHSRRTVLEDFVLATIRTSTVQLKAHTQTLKDEATMIERARVKSPLPRFPLEDAIGNLKVVPLYELDEPMLVAMVGRLLHQFRHVEALTPQIEDLAAQGVVPPESVQIVERVEGTVDEIITQTIAIIGSARDRRAKALLPRWALWFVRAKAFLIARLGHTNSSGA